MVYDCHVHTTPPEIIKDWKKFGEDEEYFNLLSSSRVNRFADTKHIIDYMNTNTIEKSIIFGFAFELEKNIRMVNEYVIESVKKYPDELIGFGIVNPNQRNLKDEIKFCIDNGLLGFGELFPSGQKFDISDYNTMKPLVDFTMEYQLPLLIHANEPIGHYYPGKTDTSLNQIYKFAENFPDQIIIYAHFGGGLPFYELMPEVKNTLKNTYYDTAAAPYLFSNQIYKTLDTMGLSKKIVFGSDYPLPPAIETKKIISNSELSPENISRILSGNLISILTRE
ncbi:MAG: amidohydrolase family protein [Tissierellia bacterium]|nr:amidohydrolase family protein [Tissierellia bacterium]